MPDQPDERAAPQQPQAPAAGGPLRDPMLWRIGLAIAVLCAPQIAVIAFGSVFLHDRLHLGTVAISEALAAVQAGAAVMRVWSGRWTDRHGNRRGYMRACSIGVATLFALLALQVFGTGTIVSSPATIALVLTLVAGGIAASAWHGVAFTELAVRAGAQRAGTALGLGNTCVFATVFLTPVVIPPLLWAGSWPLVWGAAAAAALLAFPLLPRAARPAETRGDRSSHRMKRPLLPTMVSSTKREALLPGCSKPSS